MVRINLLPQKREARWASDGNQTWWLGVLGAVVLEIIILLFVHKAQDDELVRIQRENARIQAQIDDVKQQMANHGEIKAQLKVLKDREEAISKLQTSRTGPTQALLELSRLLSPGHGPTTDRDKLEQLRRDNPAAAPNPSWDPRRLWLTKYAEQAKSVRLGGLARDAEDVSEFLRRMTVSDYFTDVKMLPATKQNDPTSGVQVVSFEFSAKVKY